MVRQAVNRLARSSGLVMFSAFRDRLHRQSGPGAFLVGSLFIISLTSSGMMRGAGPAAPMTSFGVCGGRVDLGNLVSRRSCMFSSCVVHCVPSGFLSRLIALLRPLFLKVL